MPINMRRHRLATLVDRLNLAMKVNHLVLLLGLVFFPELLMAMEWEDPYCDLPPCFALNLACDNNGAIGKACNKTARQLREDEIKNHFEYAFNSLRNNVAGGRVYRNLRPAAKMVKMSWNPELAYFARLDVNRCRSLPQVCMRSQSFYHVGRLAEKHVFPSDNYTSDTLTIYDTIKRITSGWISEARNIMPHETIHLPPTDDESFVGMSCNSCPPFGGNRFPSCFERYNGASSKKNPGNVQTLHSLAHNVMPKFYDGVELDYYHRLAPNKFISAAWVLSHMRASGFRIGGLYTFRVIDDFMLTPTIIGDIHPTTLAANLNILYYPFKPLRLEAVLQKPSEDKAVETQYTIEYTRPSDTWTANLYNVRNDNGRCTLSVMRSITQHWAIGGELLLEWNEPKNLMKDLAFAARYSHHQYSIAATASRMGLDVSYWQRIHPQIQMANLLAWNRSTRKTIATICYQWNFWNCAVNGMIDSDALVGVMWTKYLSQIPLQVGFSVVLSLPTDRFAFGMRFVLDPSSLRRGD